MLEIHSLLTFFKDYLWIFLLGFKFFFLFSNVLGMFWVLSIFLYHWKKNEKFKRRKCFSKPGKTEIKRPKFWINWLIKTWKNKPFHFIIFIIFSKIFNFFFSHFNFEFSINQKENLMMMILMIWIFFHSEPVSIKLKIINSIWSETLLFE